MAKTYKQVGDEQERRLLADFIRGFRARSCPGRNNGCNSGTFSKENQPKGKRGRPKGSRNVLTREIKEALLAACEAYGVNGKGEGGLVGYLYRVCDLRPDLVAYTLLKVMQMQKDDMTAPERFADSQIPLAPRAPSSNCFALRNLYSITSSAQSARQTGLRIRVNALDAPGFRRGNWDPTRRVFAGA